MLLVIKHQIIISFQYNSPSGLHGSQFQIQSSIKIDGLEAKTPLHGRTLFVVSIREVGTVIIKRKYRHCGKAPCERTPDTKWVVFTRAFIIRLDVASGGQRQSNVTRRTKILSNLFSILESNAFDPIRLR